MRFLTVSLFPCNTHLLANIQYSFIKQSHDLFVTSHHAITLLAAQFQHLQRVNHRFLRISSVERNESVFDQRQLIIIRWICSNRVSASRFFLTSSS